MRQQHYHDPIMETIIALLAGVLITAFGVGLFWVAVSFTARPALGHSFYPNECCSGRDCDAISKSRVSIVEGGYLLDNAYFIPELEARKSLDGRYHACFPNPQKLRCFFAPVQSM